MSILRSRAAQGEHGNREHTPQLGVSRASGGEERQIILQQSRLSYTVHCFLCHACTSCPRVRHRPIQILLQICHLRVGFLQRMMMFCIIKRHIQKAHRDLKDREGDCCDSVVCSSPTIPGLMSPRCRKCVSESRGRRVSLYTRNSTPEAWVRWIL